MTEFLIAIFSTEALISLFKRADPLKAFREWAKKNSGWLKAQNGQHLFDCGYCLSFWVALIIWSLIEFQITKWICCVLVIHRGANLVHDLLDVVVGIKINLRLFNRE